MKVKTNVKAGSLLTNHNQTAPRGLKVKTKVKAGHWPTQHNQTAQRAIEIKSKQRFRSKRAWVKMTLSFIAIALVAMTIARASAIPASAQLDPTGGYDIFQNGIRVGEIYVPERDPGSIYYVEHWVLYNSYVYPSKDMPELKTEIRLAQKSNYESEADFFARAPFGPGYRYVRADCTDTDRLPGR
jgi:hypothetical protein